MPRRRTGEPLQYGVFPSPNTDHSQYLTADEYLAACRRSPGGVGLRLVSTDIESIRYDLANQTLFVTFVNKKRKRGSAIGIYRPVPEQLVELFFNASSKGQYHHLMFRDRLGHLFAGYG